VNKLVLKLLFSKYERQSCNARITKNDVTLAAGLIALLFNPEAPRPTITRAEDSGKTIKLIEEEKKKP
jgi:hypothetical protein